jgi:hypothetical protein
MKMRRRGLFIINFGFLNIALSPVGSASGHIRYGMVITGIFFILLGWYYFHKDAKAAKQADAIEKGES